MLGCRGHALEMSRPLVMGILNVTPDSFSDGGRFFAIDAALERARQMLAEGADIIDVGGESTRPGADAVGVEEELRRVVPVVEAIVRQVQVPVSIDTFKARVMREACAAGACMVNDVTALAGDPDSLRTVRELDVPVCLMHMQGRPRDMQARPVYQDVVREVKDYLRQRTEQCLTAGMRRERIILDPGFGFGKTDAHNLRLLKHLDQIAALGFPLLVGMSRKSTIGRVLNLPLEERLEGGLAMAVMAAWQGARIIRTHDVRATARAMAMTAAVLAE